MPHRTCIVIYGDNKKKLEKKYLKMRRQYQTSQRNNFDIRTLGPADFKFKAVSMAFAVTDEEMEKITKKPKKNKKR
jgi:hypothetical protein